MSLDLRTAPPWLATVLLAEDDTEESVMGSDLHQEAIGESHATLFEYAEELMASGALPWYVSTQVTVITALPERDDVWRPKPDLFVVLGVPARSRTSYDTRTEGPMPAFVLEVASDSTWHIDVGKKVTLYGLAGVQEYLIFDPAGEFMGEQVRAWHRSSGAWRSWQPITRGAGPPVWESRVLGLALRPEGLRLRFDHPERGPLPIRRDLLAARRAAEARAAAAEEQSRNEQQARQAAVERAAAAEARAQQMADELAAARAELARRRARPDGENAP